MPAFAAAVEEPPTEFLPSAEARVVTAWSTSASNTGLIARNSSNVREGSVLPFSMQYLTSLPVTACASLV